jgi:metal-sulfur cluster biosynthetic enzyme
LKTFEGDITAAREVEARGPGQTTWITVIIENKRKTKSECKLLQMMNRKYRHALEECNFKFKMNLNVSEKWKKRKQKIRNLMMMK